ncbi:molybdopterin synthase catalytic subunit-like [Saccoglossus kowalevskii]|uniref:Molybdopterin synthase catalytic subunit n=1 Tax=Saccoglossus kowalevskii TaxID=10224 RepID=A0ABM0GSY4_SACKO|nr:PREDICTED: molybdopterin synthase catalytic subunit-like [Saccoglossus kowalevskii]
MSGEDVVAITPDKLNVEEITEMVKCPQAGAVTVFLGTTRDNFEDKKVIKLEYEAYVPMAEAEMRKLCHQIREKWNVEKIAIIHRIGIVPVMDASVIIAVSSVHRKESVEAVHYCIDSLKSSVPIWKKEVYGDGSCNWKENKECDWAARNTDSQSS